MSDSTAASERAEPASGPRRIVFFGGCPARFRADANSHFRKQQGRLVECGYAVCPGVYFGEDVVAFVGADSEFFSGEVEEVDFAGGVVDFEADVPAVFCGVAVCGCVRAVGSGDGGCCEDFCDDCLVGVTAGGADGDCAEGFSEGVYVFDGGTVGFGGGEDAVDGFTCGLVGGCAEGVVCCFECGDCFVECVRRGDRCGEGAFCTLHDCGWGEVEWHVFFLEKGIGGF